MKAYVSYFPAEKVIVSLPSGQIVTTYDLLEVLLAMHRTGIIVADVEWIEHRWDRNLFPMLATLKRYANGMFVSTLPNGVTYRSKNEIELMETMGQAGATGLVPGCMDTWEPLTHCDDAGNHMFTDRGNKFTFDRANVSDAEIEMALQVANAQFGAVHLTGSDPVFTDRMAQIAGELGIQFTR